MSCNLSIGNQGFWRAAALRLKRSMLQGDAELIAQGIARERIRHYGFALRERRC